MANLGPGGGYVFGSIHNIQAHVPPANIVAMFKTARAVGQYPLGGEDGACYGWYRRGGSRPLLFSN